MGSTKTTFLSLPNTISIPQRYDYGFFGPGIAVYVAPYFNSTEVRLWGTVCKSYLTHLWNFNSTEVRLWAVALVGDNANAHVFQFHRGTIMGMPTLSRDIGLIGISIPQRYDYGMKNFRLYAASF